jgi:hypothetical protein
MEDDEARSMGGAGSAFASLDARLPAARGRGRKDYMAVLLDPLDRTSPSNLATLKTHVFLHVDQGSRLLTAFDEAAIGAIERVEESVAFEMIHYVAHLAGDVDIIQ